MDYFVGRLDKLSCLGTPLFWKRFHAAMALIWVILIPIAVATSLKSSIVFLIFVSLMTAFSGEMSSLHGATIQDEIENQVEEEVKEEVNEDCLAG